VLLREIDFLLNLLIMSYPSPVWRLVTSTQICVSSNHYKEMK